MVVSIEAAYLGDETSVTNVTKTIKGSLKDGGINVLVNSGLLPMLQIGGSIELSKDEQREAKEKAERACGNSNDTACIEVKRQEFARSRLAEKENETKSSTANIVKGRRLIVQINENGKKKLFQVPEGQYFKYGKEQTGGKPLLADKNMPSIKFQPSSILTQIGNILLTIFMTFTYAFSILATYRVFMLEGNKYIAYAATASAVFIPYSGIFIMIAFFAVKTILKSSIKSNV